jgi:hypothetical protein
MANPINIGTIVDQSTSISTTWGQGINDWVYAMYLLTGQPATDADLRTNIGAAASGTNADITKMTGIVDPLFFAYRSTNQSITSTTPTPVQFDAEVHDLNGNYDTATYKFQPTVAGFYQINWSVDCWANAGTMNYAYSQLHKHSSAYLLGSLLTTSTGAHSRITSTGSTIVQMNGISDYLQIIGFITGTSPYFYGSVNATTFSGHLIKAT